MPYASRTKRNRALRQRRKRERQTRQACATPLYTRIRDARDSWVIEEPEQNLPEPDEVLPTLTVALAEHLRETVIQLREDGLSVPKPLLPLLEVPPFMEHPAEDSTS